MSALQKATLVEITPDEKATPVGSPVPVQFNPATMRLQISNSTEGGESRGRQTRQYLGSSSTTLTIDLIFDTADEGTTDAPRSVRERTAIVEQFVFPKSQDQKKQAPPKLRFQWGPLVLDGVLDSINIDIEHFAPDGTPLRAKVAVSLKEQNSKYQFGATGPGANSQSAPSPGQPSPGLPGSGAGASTQSAAAIAGETAADFAARVGLDPSAWRGLDIGASGSLSLDAGLEVGFSADLSVSAGLGVTAGVEAGVSASLEASVGLDASASVGVSASASFSADVAAGFSLSAAGGVSAAIAQVQTASAATAVQQTAQAFSQSLPAATGPAVQASPGAVVASSPPPRIGLPDQPRQPLSQTGLPSASQQAAAAPAPPPPRADSRANSFGFGVPLRSTVGNAATQRADVVVGSVVLKSQVGSGDPPLTNNPVIPPWIALPGAEFVVDTAGTLQLRRRPQPSCGCSCGCGCKGHAKGAHS
jgi:hypothetical protein